MSIYLTIPINSDTKMWMPGCASDDFKNIAMGIWNQYDYGITISNDYGTSWYYPSYGLTQNGSGTNATRSIACSSDFSRLTIVKENGNIFTSSNYGITWNKNVLAAKSWKHVCGSSDMTKQAAVVYAGGIWLSTNSGSTWTQSTAPTANWGSICCSSDGLKLAAVASSGNVNTSINGGSTWIDRASGGTRAWRHIACSSDGGNLVATVESTTTGNVVISRDSGVTWTNISLPLNASKSSNPVACSSDFKNIIVGSYESNNLIYSTDYGYNWSLITNSLSSWHSCIVKNNNVLVARLTTSNLYVGNFGLNDTSPYTVNSVSEQSFIRYYPVMDSTSGVLFDRPLSYMDAFYRFNFSSGTVDGWTVQTSTGLDPNFGFDRSSANTIVFKNLSSLTSPGNNFPNGGNPSQVVLIPNLTSSNNASYLQSNLQLYFKNISISFWINPLTVAFVDKYFCIVDISPGSSSGVINIMIDGNEKKIAMFINNFFGGSYAIAPQVIPVNTWTHVVCMYNSITQIGTIYINGVYSANAWYGSGVDLNNYNLTLIGMKYGYNDNIVYKAYNGYMAFYNVFNRVLTQYEVNYLYNNPGQPFANINANSLSQLYGGGLPFLRGQEAFGNSSYSRMVKKYNSPVIYPDLAPYYTCYDVGTYTHTLRTGTNRIFILAIGGGGGGGGGNYYNGGSYGGGGGGGGGGGMAYTYYEVSASDTISVTVGAGGAGGQSGVNLASNVYFIGGNGLSGSPSIVTINSEEVCRGRAGARATHTNNPNTDTSVVYSGITAAMNNVGGNGGAGGLYVASSNTGVSGGSNAGNGNSGGTDTDYSGQSTPGGTGGGGGFSGGLLLDGQIFIYDYGGTFFLTSTNSQFASGSSLRNFGNGGNGGRGEGDINNSNLPGSAGQDGAVIIFEYCV